MKSDFLLEIGTEEIPASYLEPGIKSLKGLLTDCLKNNLIKYGDAKKFYTPRRLAILIRDISPYGEDTVTTITGPPKETAFKDGKPTQQLIGFVKAHNVFPKEVSIIKKGKREVVRIEKRKKGVCTKELLKEVLPLIIAKVEFPRSMRWEPSGFRFARPIRWIVCLMGKEVIKVHLADISSDRKTMGLRFEKELTIDEPKNYETLLEDNHIIPDPIKRKEKIKSRIKSMTEEKGINLIEDEQLLSEVTNMVESPITIIGKFNRSYLSLPDDIIRVALKSHQRYFWTGHSRKGTNYFVSVANNPYGDIDVIRKGNERVLNARLEDAKFYLKEDMQIPLEERLNALKEMVYDTELGTLYDKTNRLVELSTFIAQWIDGIDLKSLKRAALLSKTDLTTDMIKDGKEFTELEGIIGAEYARLQGEDDKVTKAIRQHYLPGFAGDRLPESNEGVVLSLTDKIDSLVGAYITSGIPTSSKDPRGMRRNANGIVKILIKRSMALPIRDVIKKAFSLYGKEYSDEVFDFAVQRCKTYLIDRGIPYDVVMGLPRVEDILDMRLISDAIVEAGDIQALVMVVKRMGNILKSSGDLQVSIDPKSSGNLQVSIYPKSSGNLQVSIYPKSSGNLQVSIDLLIEPEEKALFLKAKETEKGLKRAVAKKKFKEAIELLRNLVPYINKLFDKVLIMASDEKIKNNRIALLNYVYGLFLGIADFKSFGVK